MALIAGGALLAGCEGVPTTSPSSSGVPASSGNRSATAPATAQDSVGSAGFVRRSARAWVADIPGCVGATDLDPNALASAVPALKPHQVDLPLAGSAAQCSEEGHPLVVLAFTDPTSEQTAVDRLRVYLPLVATGPGWLALPADPDSPPQDLSLVEDVVRSLNGQVLYGTGSSGSAGYSAGG